MDASWVVDTLNDVINNCITLKIQKNLSKRIRPAHLHETGTDLKLIQELLGHNDIKTTLRYTDVSNRTLENIKSPFDNLNLNNE